MPIHCLRIAVGFALLALCACSEDEAGQRETATDPAASEQGADAGAPPDAGQGTDSGSVDEDDPGADSDDPGATETDGASPLLEQPEDPLLVRTTSGLVRGHMHNGEEPTPEFLGIYYAASTGGQNRLRPPQPREPWGDEIYEADLMGPDCPNPAESDGIFGGLITPRRGGVHLSEDCLFLSIWTTSTDVEAKRPVMIWIHGGGLRIDGSNRRPYAGNHLATQGDVVVVSVNYRQAGSAMMTHPAFEDPETGYFGNWNILDFLAAAKWVHQNIRYFGGDPGNVTFFGESGGSVGVNDLSLVLPEVRNGLFHRIIGQSGDPVMTSLETHRMRAEEAVASMGCDIDDNVLECVRNADYETWRAASDAWSGWPAPDGKILHAGGVTEAIHEGVTEGLTIIGGNNGDERPGTSIHWNYLAQHNLHAHSVESSALAYRYHMVDSPGIAARHGTDVALALGTWDDDVGSLNNLHDRDNPATAVLAARMIKAWTNFARTGDPSFEDPELGTVEWLPYEQDGQEALIWNESPHMEERELGDCGASCLSGIVQ